MTITIGTSTFSNLTAQPFGYEETEVSLGRTARKWELSGLLLPSEWLDLLGVYDEWRDLRIEDEDSKTSGVVGTTIDFSGTGPGGQSWTNVACWFLSAPSAEQSGAYLSAKVVIVDASQALEVLLKTEEETEEDQGLPDLGTFTVGSTVLTLLKPPETYGQPPQLELTPGGVHYITGPKVAVEVRSIEGTTDASGWNGVLSWYESEVGSTPSSGNWFPISAPTASAEKKVIDGVSTVVYTVSIELARVVG